MSGADKHFSATRSAICPSARYAVRGADLESIGLPVACSAKAVRLIRVVPVLGMRQGICPRACERVPGLISQMLVPDF
eukprot:3888766-Rhodomonas_salina.3